MPEVSNLRHHEEEKLVNHLNACSSGGLNWNGLVYSPFSRGEIYCGNGDTYSDLNSSLTPLKLINNIVSDNSGINTLKK